MLSSVMTIQANLHLCIQQWGLIKLKVQWTNNICLKRDPLVMTSEFHHVVLRMALLAHHFYNMTSHGGKWHTHYQYYHNPVKFGKYLQSKNWVLLQNFLTLYNNLWKFKKENKSGNKLYFCLPPAPKWHHRRMIKGGDWWGNLSFTMWSAWTAGLVCFSSFVKTSSLSSVDVIAIQWNG